MKPLVSPSLQDRLVGAMGGPTPPGNEACISFDGPKEVSAFRDVTLLRGLYMEASTGLKMSRGVSCWSIAKREHGLRGNKARVFEQLAEIMFKRHGVDLRGLTAKLKERK